MSDRILELIQSEPRPLERRFLLAGALAYAFRGLGYEPIVVGGAAMEYYSEGRIPTTDLDFCWLMECPSEDVQREVIGSFGGRGGPRTWRVANEWVDLLGSVKSDGVERCRVAKTKNGSVRIFPLEELTLHRVLASTSDPFHHSEPARIAREMMTACVSNAFLTDWTYLETRAASPGLFVQRRLRTLRRRVSEELGVEINGKTSRNGGTKQHADR